MMLTYLIGWRVVLTVCGCLACAIARGGDSAANRVFASDIPKKVTLIGRLGVPLMTVVSLRGRWERLPQRTKLPSFRFIVTSVDGHSLAHPVDFSVSNVEAVIDTGTVADDPGKTSWKWEAKWTGEKSAPEPVDGEEWEMVAFETGSMAGLPERINNMLQEGQNPKKPVAFVTSLRFASARCKESRRDRS